MKHFPKITIITPSYNQGKFLEQTILSVLEQNYPSLEYIIIDGGSKDDSVEIIKKYADKLTFWISEPDNGQTDAINKGMKLATGDIINWLNSDDFYEKDCLWEIANIFSENQQVNCVAGKERRLDEKGKVINISEGTEFPSDQAYALFKSHIDQPSTFFRREAIREYFPLPLELKFTMDSYLWTRFLLNNTGNTFIESPNIWVNFRYHSDSKTMEYIEEFNDERKSYRSRLIAEIKNGKFVEFPNHTESHILEKFVQLCTEYDANETKDPSYKYRNMAGAMKILNRKGDSIKFAWKAVRQKPTLWLNWKVFIKSVFS